MEKEGPVMEQEVEKIIDPNRSYKLPSSLALVLGAERGELVAVTIRQVKAGELPVTKELVTELLALVGNLVNDLREKKHKLFMIEECVGDLMNDVSETRSRLLKAVRAVKEIESVLNDDLIEEDE